MNIYTGLLFLHGYRIDLDRTQDYGPSFGNDLANQRALRERWELDATPDVPAANDADHAPRPNDRNACA